MDLTIPLAANYSGSLFEISAIAALPNQPESIVVSYRAGPIRQTIVFDGATQRRAAIDEELRSIYILPSDGMVFASTARKVLRLAIDSGGISVVRASEAPLSDPSWSGNLATDGGIVYNAQSEVLLGRTAIDSNGARSCAVIDTSQDNVIGFWRVGVTTMVGRFSLTTLRPLAMSPVEFTGAYDSSLCAGATGVDNTLIHRWGANGLVVVGGTALLFYEVDKLAPVAAGEPAVTVEHDGIVHVSAGAEALVYDSQRDRVWASVAGASSPIGNSVLAIEPGSGRITDIVPAGSDPGPISLSMDGNTLFTALTGACAVTAIDLQTKTAGARFPVIDTSAETRSYWSGPASLMVIPGQPDTLAITRTVGYPIVDWKTEVYVRGVPQARAVRNPVSKLIMGDSPSSIYGYSSNLREEHFPARPFYRMTVSADGVVIDRQLNNIVVTARGSAAYKNGRIFGSWHVYTADTGQLAGHISTGGFPLPLAARDRVAYVDSTETEVTVTLYDAGTYRALSQRRLPKNGELQAAILAGEESIAFATTREVVLVPVAALRIVPDTPVPEWEPAGEGVRRLRTRANAIAGAPSAGKILVATAGALGSLGNSIWRIDAASGALEDVTFIGSEPSRLAMTQDETAVYAWLSGENRIARMLIEGARRDLVFRPTPDDRILPNPVYDFTAGPDGSLAVSFEDGSIAIFDGDRRRLRADPGNGQLSPPVARYQLAFDETGSVLYAFNDFLTTRDLVRASVTENGVAWMTNTRQLLFTSNIRRSGRFLFTSAGEVADPERARIVAKLSVPRDPTWNAYLVLAGGRLPTVLGFSSHVVIDPASQRVYLLAGAAESSTPARLLMYDLESLKLIGSMPLPMLGTGRALNLVKVDAGQLAFNTTLGEVYLVRVEAIPLLENPVPATFPALPATEGVTVIDLAAIDLAYDSERNRIYASVPNSEGAMGDRIAEIDPATGAIGPSYPAGISLEAISFSHRPNQLIFSFNAQGSVTERNRLAAIDIVSGQVGREFGPLSDPDAFYTITGLAALPGAPGSIAALERKYVNTGRYWAATSSRVRIYDDGSPRRDSATDAPTQCLRVIPSTDASTLYCVEPGDTITLLDVHSGGVSTRSSISLDPYTDQTGRFDTMSATVAKDGRIYTSRGLVLDRAASTVLAKVEAAGSVAADEDRVYWLAPRESFTSTKTAILRSFDTTSLERVGVKTLNVTLDDASGLITCGRGCLAFRAGKEIYIVRQ